MKTVMFLDTTLRDGEQTPGVSFSKKEKLEIAQMLDSLGIDIIEAGIPAMGKNEMDSITAILNLGLNAEILTWNRLLLEDIQKSIACGSKHIHIAAPVSDLHIAKKLNKTREWVLYNTQKLVAYCVEKGCSVSVGAEDASRTDPDFLLKYYNTAIREGASRVRYADTVGIQDPFTVYNTIKNLREHIDVHIDYHGHNDFGMSTGNAYAAFKAGAAVLSCSINGLGERAGNTPLEEITMAIKHIAKKHVHIDTKLFAQASAMVERYSKRAVHPGKAIVGKQVYWHESGIHVDGLLKDEKTYQPYPPEDAGGKREIVLGKFSGRKAIEYVYRKKGLELSQEQTNELLSVLKRSHM
ncbi:homoaconitate hydratase [Bacillota bacterium LX-D]|nr:homoaconitate hydratase [Bacillota bacterium LX-D]